MDADAILFCKCVMVEIAFLGALSVHVIELLKFAIRKPTLECHEGNPRFRGCLGRLSRLAQANTAKVRGQLLGGPIGHDCTSFPRLGPACKSARYLARRSRTISQTR